MTGSWLLRDLTEMTSIPRSDATLRAHRPAKPDSEQLWANLADLILILSRQVRFHGEGVRLSLPEGLIMRHLVHHGPTAPSRIAIATGLQRTNVSTALLSLQRKGLVRREASTGDGCRITVCPTRRGHTAYHLIRRRWAATMSAAAARDGAGLDEALSLLVAIRDGVLRAETAFREG